ncbi:hypothetical protein AAC387_Pa12g1901 [Persea americana]
MEGCSPTQRELKAHPLHSFQVEPRAYFNRVHSLVYICAILGLFYHRLLQLFHCTTFSSFSVFLTMLLSEAVLAFMWLTTFSFRWRPTRRQAFPENLSKLIKDEDLPSLDVFICTADPYKEPPVNVVNTALSVMAFDYPTEKISVYVSDDGGSELTLFAFMEGAKFARHWLPFCRENGIEERCPEAYFRSTEGSRRRGYKIKGLYEDMKDKVERAMEAGKVSLDQVTSDEEREAFKKWTDGFTRQNHPTVIQVLVESSKDVDVSGHKLPNLIYVSREKRTTSPHHFKAGALNVLVRVSGVMSNAPVVLTLDCDMYSNDPLAPRRALCYLLDPQKASKLAFVQFPQRYQGINSRPSSSSSSLSPPPPLDVPDYKCNGTMNGCTIRSDSVLKVAHKVAGCNFEHGTSWGSEMGFRYGSLVEDYYTGYRLHCEGWETVFCHPEKAAFLGDIPISLDDALSQNKRWCVGLLEVGFSKYSPVTFGTTRISLLMGLCYAHYAFWSLWSIPMAAYGFLPQLALLNQFQLFPKVSDPWFYLYVYLFIATGFNVTSKVIDDEQDKHYKQGIFEFGFPSPLFVPLVMVATINLIAFVVGLAGALMHWNIEDMFVQLFISGFVVVNSWPIYEAMVLRKDKGSMPSETTIKSAFLAGLLYLLAYFTFRI